MLLTSRLLQSHFTNTGPSVSRMNLAFLLILSPGSSWYPSNGTQRKPQIPKTDSFPGNYLEEYQKRETFHTSPNTLKILFTHLSLQSFRKYLLPSIIIFSLKSLLINTPGTLLHFLTAQQCNKYSATYRLKRFTEHVRTFSKHHLFYSSLKHLL